VDNEYAITEVEARLVRAFGQQDELERLEEGLLSKKESDNILREVVFGPVYDWPLADKLKPVAVVKLANLRHHKIDPLPLNSRVEFHTGPAEDLDRDCFEHLKTLRGLYPDCKVTPLCTLAAVGKLKYRRYKARVTVMLGERPLIREMWLDDADETYDLTNDVSGWRAAVAAEG
jgi:hypothetical protein